MTKASDCPPPPPCHSKTLRMSTAEIALAIKGLKIAQIVAISVDVGLSLSYADKRTRAQLISKWNAQSASLRSLLLSRARDLGARRANTSSTGKPPVSSISTPVAHNLPAVDVSNLPVKALQLAMQASGVPKAWALAATRAGAQSLYLSLRESLRAEVLARARAISTNGKRYDLIFDVRTILNW